MKGLERIGRIAIALAFSVVVGIVATPAELAYASSGVAINSDNFPDKTFRDYVSNVYDKDKNSVLSQSEIRNATLLGGYYDESSDKMIGAPIPEGISNIKGVEYFTNAKKIVCSNQSELTSVDFSKNTKLEYIGCFNGNLKTINVSHNTALVTLAVYNNQLSSLDLNNNTKLKTLYCYENKLTKLDVNKNTDLKELHCSYNKISKLDVSHNNALSNLNCEDNQLDSLNVAKNTALKNLNCSYNRLQSLNMNKNTKLEELYCSGNKITNIDVSKNTKLVRLYCYENKLTKLDVNKNTDLKELYCSGNKLTNIDVSKNTKLVSLYCDNNKLENLFLEKNKSLVDIDCGNNKLTSLDLSKNTKLEELVCGNNMLTKFCMPVGVRYCYADFEMEKNKIGRESIEYTNSAGKKLKCEIVVCYKDVYNNKDFWYEPTYYLSAKDVVKGYDNQTKFKPANDCTRAQMVTFLWRLAGSPAPKTKKTQFTDIKKSDYFYKPVLWAVENGITTGVSKEKFNPQGVCTRAQTVTFLWRMAGKPSTETANCSFKDVKQGDYYHDAVIWAAKKKIVAGYDDGSFKPQGKCLRRQMVTFLYKYDKNVGKVAKATPTPTATPTAKPTNTPSKDNAIEKEPNNTFNTSTTLMLGIACKGEIGDYDRWAKNGLDEDWFKIDVSKGKTYRFVFEGYTGIFDETSLLISGYYGADNAETDNVGEYLSNKLSSSGKDYYDFVAGESSTLYIRVYNFFNWSSSKGRNGVIESTDYKIAVKEK